MGWQDEVRVTMRDDWVEEVLAAQDKPWFPRGDAGIQWCDVDERTGVADIRQGATIGCIRTEVERLALEANGYVEWFIHHTLRYGCAVTLWRRGKGHRYNKSAPTAGLCALRALQWLHEEVGDGS